jgi:membrane protease YdiL (CAAX protease family)
VDDWKDVELSIWAWLLLAVGGAIILAGWWWFFPSARRSLPTLSRRRRISWRGIDVFIAFLLVPLISGLVEATLKRAGLFDWLYGEVRDSSTSSRQLLWSSSLATPLVVGLIVLSLQQLRGTRLAELGFTRTRIAANIRLGYGVWLFLAPAALALYYLVVVLIDASGGAINKHPLSEAGEQPLALVEWLLLGVSAAVLAPLEEELLFRGLLLRWQLRGGWEAQATVAFCALFFAALFGAHEQKPYNGGSLLFVLAMLPLLFVLPYAQLRHAQRELASAEAPLDQAGWAKRGLLDVLLCAGDRRAQPALAICTNALFFASVHTPVWPSPIPLFVLGIGLAWVTYRTSSLVPALTLHALFNALAVLSLVLEHTGVPTIMHW